MDTANNKRFKSSGGYFLLSIILLYFFLHTFSSKYLNLIYYNLAKIGGVVKKHNQKKTKEPEDFMNSIKFCYFFLNT